jgi:hypothetical protein
MSRDWGSASSFRRTGAAGLSPFPIEFPSPPLGLAEHHPHPPLFFLSGKKALRLGKALYYERVVSPWDNKVSFCLRKLMGGNTCTLLFVLFLLLQP